MSDQPLYIWALVLLAATGMPAITSIMLYRGAVAAGLGRGAAIGVAAAAAAAFGGWLVITGFLALALVYRGPQSGLWFGLATIGPLVALVLATRIPVVARVLADPGTTARLTVPHTVRVTGIVFLMLMVQGQLSAGFALPAGLGDIATGLAAPFVARWLARAPRHADVVAAAARFHLLGTLDLLVALSLGVLLGPPWLLGGTPSTELLRLLPAALIPTAAVPLAVALHIVTLGRLRRASVRRTAPDTATRPQGEPWSRFVPKLPSEEQP
jgi:hypothetical protein